MGRSGQIGDCCADLLWVAYHTTSGVPRVAYPSEFPHVERVSATAIYLKIQGVSDIV